MLFRSPAVRGLLLGRMTAAAELMPLVKEADTLLDLCSGRPQMLLPVRIRLR